jgi:hypothetical protein
MLRVRLTWLALAGVLAASAGCMSSESAPETGPSAAERDAAIAAEAQSEPGSTDAQRAALEAQTASGEGEPDPASAVAPADVARLLAEGAGAEVTTERTDPAYDLLSLPTTDAEGNPLPGSDALVERFGSFVVYVSTDPGKRLADVGAIGDVVPAQRPDADGLVWRAEEDAVGDRYHTAHAFYADGRVMLAWLGGPKPVATPELKRIDGLLRGLDSGA